MIIKELQPGCKTAEKSGCPLGIFQNLTFWTSCLFGLQLKTAPLSKFTKGKFAGRLQDDDLYLVIGTIKESPREKKANLLRFGII